MVILIVVVCLFLWGTRGRRRMGYGLAGIIVGLALAFSYARSAWLGLFGGLVTVGLLRGRKALLAILAGTVVLALLLFLLQPSVRLQIGEAYGQLEDPMTKSSRVQLWSTVVKIIADHPLLGVGLGQVRGALVAYGCDLGYSHPHNDLLNQAANAGLLGLAAFLWIWVTFLRKAFRCYSVEMGEGFARALVVAGFGLMVAFLLAGLFQCYYTDAEDGMILWFLLGLVTAVCRLHGSPAGGSKKPFDEQEASEDGSVHISSKS
jgi:O-antigen ligase